MNWDTLADAKILIVDDEPTNTKLLERLLQMVGLRNCRSVHDPREALGVFREFQPDLVMLDLSMPYMDGFELLSLIRTEVPRGEFLPVLILTAQLAGEVIQQALGSGANDLVTKPFHQAEVILRVHNLLETRHLHRETLRSNETLESVVAERTKELSQALLALKDAQEQVIQQERLKALGTMASGVAHDFNNALSIILGLGEFVRRSCQSTPGMTKASDQMDVVMATAEDAAKIVGRLRSFHSTDTSTDESPVNLGDLVREAVTATEPRWKTQALRRGAVIELRCDLEEIPPFWGHAHELREVLINLIFNAVDAMPDGGELTIRTGLVDDSVCVAVSDSGVGMSEDTRRKCLEPFFTTKGESGSGLGLAMVYGIIQRHQGRLDIRSEIGQGAAITLQIPVRFATSPPEKPAVLTATAHPLRILVVEDQEEIRDIIVAQISDDLHTVEAVSDGQEAADRLASTRFDLVITDQAMPGMNGDQLAAFIKKTYPDTRIILLSGFGGPEEGEEMTTDFDLVLGKPISQADFKLGISKVMAARPPVACAPSTLALT